ncbi:hypothetical protein JOM56_010012 [Amanita muscaria]
MNIYISYTLVTLTNRLLERHLAMVNNHVILSLCLNPCLPLPWTNPKHLPIITSGGSWLVFPATESFCYSAPNAFNTFNAIDLRMCQLLTLYRFKSWFSHLLELETFRNSIFLLIFHKYQALSRTPPSRPGLGLENFKYNTSRPQNQLSGMSYSRMIEISTKYFYARIYLASVTEDPDFAEPDCLSLSFVCHDFILVRNHGPPKQVAFTAGASTSKQKYTPPPAASLATPLHQSQQHVAGTPPGRAHTYTSLMTNTKERLRDLDSGRCLITFEKTLADIHVHHHRPRASV